jgi:hypothetical protein
MRTFHWLFLMTLTIFLCGVVLAGQAAPKPAAPGPAAKAPPTGLSAKVPVKDIMNAMIVPSSTVIFSAVATITDATGVHELQPHTDDEWTNVLNNAITLTEGANLLMVPGRQRELGGAIPAAYRAEWNVMARELVEAGSQALIAASNKSPEGILNAGERIDVACDECHEKYQLTEEDYQGKVLGTFKPPAAARK